MLFKRAQVTSMGQDLPARARQGMGEVANNSVVSVATDTATIALTVDNIASGVLFLTGLTAGRILATPTAALILAAATDMDIGDSFSFTVAIIPAFAGTWSAGVGVTLVGRATVPASSSSYVTVTKLSATTVQWATT